MEGIMIGIKKTKTDEVPDVTTPVASSRRIIPAGGSFDFLGGVYDANRRKARQRFIAIVAGASIAILAIIYAGYQVALNNMTQSQLSSLQSQYASLSSQYQQQTGQVPQTRSQLQSLIETQQSALKLAASSGVDLPNVFQEVNKALPPGAELRSISVSSWKPPTENTADSPSPGASPSPTKQSWTVTATVILPFADVSALEANAAAIPFAKAVTSSTKIDGPQAETTLIVSSETPLSAADLQQLVGVN